MSDYSRALSRSTAGLEFFHMNTAMAIWRDTSRAIEAGLLSAAPQR